MGAFLTGIVFCFTILFLIAVIFIYILDKKNFCPKCGVKLDQYQLNKQIDYISNEIIFNDGKPEIVKKPNSYISSCHYAIFCPENIDHYYKEITIDPSEAYFG